MLKSFLASIRRVSGLEHSGKLKFGVILSRLIISVKSSFGEFQFKKIRGHTTYC